MDENTRRVLHNLKNLVDSRKELEERGLLSPAEIQNKIMAEEQMRYEITSLMRVAQKKLEDKKREDQNMIAKLTYRLERKIREMNRQKEEDDYRQQVEERYEARMKKEREKEDRKKQDDEEDEKHDVKTEDDKKEEENAIAEGSKNRKKRKKNNKKSTSKSEKTD